jgi:hypothetical protein
MLIPAAEQDVDIKVGFVLLPVLDHRPDDAGHVVRNSSTAAAKYWSAGRTIGPSSEAICAATVSYSAGKPPR